MAADKTTPRPPAPPDTDGLDEYVEVPEEQSEVALGIHLECRVVTGGDTADDKAAMYNRGARMVEAGGGNVFPRDGKPIIARPELCKQVVEDDGKTYLYFGRWPLWWETNKHYANYCKRQDDKRRQKFGQTVDKLRQQINDTPGAAVTQGKD